MKLKNERTYIFAVLTLAICGAARGQSSGELGLSQTWRNLSGASTVLRIQKVSPLPAGALESSGVQGEARARPGGDPTIAEAPVRSGGSVEGSVTNYSGAAVPGVVVSVRDLAGNSRTAVTDMQGKFRIAGLRGDKDATAIHNESKAVLGDDSTAKGLPAKNKVSMDGIVTAASGGPLLGVFVTVKNSQGGSKTVATDTEGKFRMEGLNWDNELNVLTVPPRAKWPDDASSQVKFWSLQGLMWGSVVAALQTTHKCIQAGSCTAIPVPFQSRTAMYNVGLPVAAGIGILSYEMKKHGNRWWSVPPLIVTAASGLLTFHSARASQ